MFLGIMGGRYVIRVSKDVYVVTGVSWSTTVYYQDPQTQSDLKSTLIDQGDVVRECLTGTLNGVQIEREFVHTVRSVASCQTPRVIESTLGDPETFHGRVEALLQPAKHTKVPELKAHRRNSGSSATSAKQVG